MANYKSPTLRRLARAKLDESGNWLRSALLHLVTPNGGWITATREALSMSQTDLARRLGVTPSSVVKLESSERAGTVRLNTLRRAAEAMDCELLVAVVPRQPLQDMVDQQRVRQFNAAFDRVALHMSLEDQSVSEDLRREMLRKAEEMIPDSALWREAP